MKRYTLEQEQALHEFLQKTRNVHERERARALVTLGKGTKRKEVAEIFEVTVKTVERWKKHFLHEGIDGIKQKKYAGNNYKLSHKQRNEIKQVLTEKTPKELRINERSFWNILSIKQFLKQQYAVVYKSDASYRKLLYGIGFSCHKPGKENRKHDKKQVIRFKIDVKKNSRNIKKWVVLSW